MIIYFNVLKNKFFKTEKYNNLMKLIINVTFSNFNYLLIAKGYSISSTVLEIKSLK